MYFMYVCVPVFKLIYFIERNLSPYSEKRIPGKVCHFIFQEKKLCGLESLTDERAMKVKRSNRKQSKSTALTNKTGSREMVR